eukprot:760764-Hanusia_phi.AAC.3
MLYWPDVRAIPVLILRPLLLRFVPNAPQLLLHSLTTPRSTLSTSGVSSHSHCVHLVRTEAVNNGLPGARVQIGQALQVLLPTLVPRSYRAPPLKVNTCTRSDSKMEFSGTCKQELFVE